MGILGRRRDGGVRGGGERRRRRRSGGKNRGGGERSGESEREPDGSGGRVASSRRVEPEPGRQGGRRWPRRVAARVGHAPLPTGARRKATGERLVGWAASWAGQVALVGAR